MSRPRIAPALDGLLAVAAALTAVLAVRTLWYVFHAVTNAPFADEWVLIDEIRRFQEGAVGWEYLWAPHWGQRAVVPRLLLLASAKLFSLSNLPLVLTGLVAQAGMLAVLVVATRRLFHGSPRLAAVCSVAFAHLLLSSLQLEIILTPTAVQHAVGYASAVSAIVLFGRRRWAGIVLGVVATACLGAGLLVWLILALEAWIAGDSARSTALPAACGAALTALYTVGYARPEMGMGVAGVARHPLEALRIVGFVLGGPVTLYSLPLGTGVGWMGLAIACALVRRHSSRPASNPAAVPLLLIAWFQVAVAASLAVGRYTPEWLAAHQGGQLLPGRYLPPAFLFWGALLALGLSTWREGGPRCAAAAATSVVVLAMTFGTWSWQWRVSREWAAAFQNFDAVASGFLLDISDQQSMAPLFPDAELRGRVLAYLRRGHLSVFAEPRAHWPGEHVAAKGNACRASTASAVPLPGGGGAVRVTGSLLVNGRQPRGAIDLLIAADNGTVVGLARSLPAESEYRNEAGFLGYARVPATGELRLLLRVEGNRVCDAGRVAPQRP